MPEKLTTSQQVARSLDQGWVHTTSFIGSILSGMLIGWLLDRWLGTDPWFLVSLALVGAYSGFMRMWHYAKLAEQQAAEIRAARDAQPFGGASRD